MKFTYFKITSFFTLNIFGLLLFSHYTFAQVSADAVINKNEIRIGDPIELHLSLSIPKDIKEQYIFPVFKDTITKQIEIIETSRIDTVQKDNFTIIEQKLKISAYDSGQFILPSIKFISKTDTSKYVLTNTLLITVHTVPTDTSETSVKDIKSIFDEPFDIKWYYPLITKIIFAVLVLALIIFLIYYYTRKNKKQQIIEKPKLPPHITALEKLQQIKEAAVWKEGKIKEYYSAVADTIREYIEGRYNIPALEQTTFEILQSLKFKAIDPATREKLKQLLELADLVKFAKFLPIESDHHQILESAFEFVHQTKQEISTNTGQNSATQTNMPS